MHVDRYVTLQVLQSNNLYKKNNDPLIFIFFSSVSNLGHKLVLPAVGGGMELK